MPYKYKTFNIGKKIVNNFKNIIIYYLFNLILINKTKLVKLNRIIYQNKNKIQTPQR